MTTWLFRTLPLLLLCAAGLAITPPAAQAQWGMTVVEIESELDKTEARRGEVVRLTVSATVDEEYHLYAMEQPPVDRSGPGPIPTSISLTGEPEVLLLSGTWREPEPTRKWDEGFERDVDVHYGSPQVYEADFVVNPDLDPGEYTLEGRFRYQACTDTGCLPPMNINFEHSFVILEGEPLEVDEAALIGEEGDGETGAAASAEETRPRGPTYTDGLAAMSFGGFLLFAFVFGLAALATPCVFPMIPITISFFSNKASKSTGQAAMYAGAYVLSIIAGFTLIGAGISFILLLMGHGVESGGFANRVAANPWVNSFFALLYLFFALALLGVFELRLPTSWSAKLNQGAMKSSGYLSIAFKALVFVIISFTCTAPLIGVLIVQAIGGEWTRPLFGMMAFSAGFALPFFFLALAPQMMSSMPKAGNWLHAVKVVMGLVVLAAAFKFISNADLIWLRQEMFFTREVLLAVWATIAVTTAFYLLGLIRVGEDIGSTLGTGRLLTGMTFGTIALYLASGLFGSSLHPWVEAYLPPNLREEAGPAMMAEGGNSGARTATGGDRISAGFSWFSEVDDAMEHARATGRNVFIDFTGYTCTNCRLMEKNMFPRPRVTDLLDQYVRVKLYTDDPDVGERHIQYQANTFGTVTLPFYAILTPDGEIIATEAYQTNEDHYVDFLRAGLEGDAEVAMTPRGGGG